LSSTGERSPIALDEVTVQNDYKRPRNWLEQYADKIVDENKDAGLMGSIFGTPISAVTSIPQMFATKAMTGNATSFRSYEYSKSLWSYGCRCCIRPS
jgi:hypothetical protein